MINLQHRDCDLQRPDCEQCEETSLPKAALGILGENG